MSDPAGSVGTTAAGADDRARRAGRAGAAEFALPDLGEGLTDAVVVRWLVEVGDRVAIDQPVVEVESAKAVVEIPCPYAGVVEARYGAEGDVVPVGTPLVRIRDRVEDAGPAPARAPETGLPPLVGFGPAATVAATTRRGRGATPQDDGRARPSDPPPTSRPTQPPRFTDPHRATGAGRSAAAVRADGAGQAAATARDPVPKVISPVVRRLAREAGLDLATLPATGAGGVIRRADVERLLTANGTGTTGAATDSTPTTVAPVVRRISLASRRTVVERLVRSRREIPEATAWRDIDVTDLLAARATINADTPDRRVSVLGLLARICVAGLARHPELNATIDADRDEIVQYPSVDLGIAVAGARGLVVPVVRNAGALTAPAMSARIRELTARAGDGSLTPAMLAGGTFTLNNHGALGTDGAVPIINHPQVAQLAVGRISERPWVVAGEIRPRHVAQLTVVFDHRACDGAPVGGFLSFVAHCVERPLLMIAEL